MSRQVTNMLLSFGALILCLVAAEAVLTVFFPIHLTAYINAYQYDEQLGVRLKEDIHFFNTTDYQQEVHTNRLGSVNFQESFEDYPVLVYAIGDSYTQGTGLPSDASYPFQLDLLLNTRDGSYQPHYGVINLGLAAFGSTQSLMSLQRFAGQLGRPQYVLYLAAFNDLRDDVLFENGYRHKQMVEGNPHFGVLLRPVQWFFNDLELGKRLKLAIKGSIRDSMLVEKYPDVDFSGLSNDPDTHGLVEVASLLQPQLEAMVEYTEQAGARLIVGWAGPLEDKEPYVWMQNWARQQDAGYADWHPLVASLLRSAPGLPVENSHSGGHYRVWVNAMIARAFAMEIERTEGRGETSTMPAE